MLGKCTIAAGTLQPKSQVLYLCVKERTPVPSCRDQRGNLGASNRGEAQFHEGASLQRRG